MLDNLTLAAPEATDRDLHLALYATGAASVLDVHPDGLDTLVGVGGHPLTDAQAQQLALARLLLTDADPVILDEATAEAGSAYAGQPDRAAEGQNWYRFQPPDGVPSSPFRFTAPA
ncbi:hypothetical protein ABZX99_26955 [Streptomyces antibioticus]|uniref:ABC transporter ATP-binding protein n=1 Tax=Streptomyces TaxID=1883 RepID=UPI001587870D|nr:ABC transporter ATP-binding protein [Streptomyces sp. CAI-85]NUV59549.1 ABC transporter ATP-binding protein [Streptomyces sp. CAI-85]